MIISEHPLRLYGKQQMKKASEYNLNEALMKKVQKQGV